MAKEPTPAQIVSNQLCWNVESDGPEVTFWARLSTFKYGMALRSRARDGEKKAVELGRKNSELLQLIGRDALASGGISKTDAFKAWQCITRSTTRFSAACSNAYERRFVQ